MLQILSEFGVNDSKNDWEGLVGECLLVYCRGYIYLRNRNMVCQFGEGIDISYLAEEFGTVLLLEFTGPPTTPSASPDNSAS